MCIRCTDSEMPVNEDTKILDDGAAELDHHAIRDGRLTMAARVRLQLREGGVVHVMSRGGVGNYYNNGELLLHGLTENGEVFAQNAMSAIFQVGTHRNWWASALCVCL